MRAVILFAWLFLCSGSLFAQSYINLAVFKHQNSLDNAYKNQNGKVDISEWNASFTLPLKRNNGDAFLIGATWNMLELRQKYPLGNGAVTSKIERLSYLLGRFGYIKKWNDTWSGTFLLLPKISSDWAEITSEDFQMGALALLNKKRNEKLTWKFGLYYNQEYFAPFFVPLFGADWKINDKWRLFGVMPSNLTIERTVSSKFRFGASIASPVVSYRLGEQNKLLPNGYIHQTYFTQFFCFADIYLNKSIVFTPKIGHSIFRNYRVFAKNDQANFNLWGIAFGDRSEERPIPYKELEDGFIFEIEVAYRYDLEKQ